MYRPRVHKVSYPFGWRYKTDEVPQEDVEMKDVKKAIAAELDKMTEKLKAASTEGVGAAAPSEKLNLDTLMAILEGISKILPLILPLIKQPQPPTPPAQ